MSGLHLDHVRRRYPAGGGVEVGPLSFEAGRLTALIGPNGAGKSTLIKALVGAITAEVGGLRLGSRTLSDPGLRARQIAYLSQDRVGPGLASVREVVALGRHPYGGADPDGRVDQALDRLGLSGLSARPFGALSGGEQARVLLARALAVDAPVLLADEPIASLDPHHALQALGLLQAEARQGRVVILSLHDLSLTERFCDQALVLNQGRAVAHGPVAEALSAAILRDVFQIARNSTGFDPL